MSIDPSTLRDLPRWLRPDTPTAIREALGRAQLAAFRDAQHSTSIAFDWHGGRRFTVNGEPVEAQGLGLVIGWMTFCGEQHGIAAPPASTIYPGARRPDRAALEAVHRASLAPGLPDALGRCLRLVGTAEGRLAVKGLLPVKVQCGSPALVAAIRADDARDSPRHSGFGS